MKTNNIKKLDAWDFVDTKRVPDGYVSKQIPEATPDNMVKMMDKINELVEVINTLTK